MSDETKVSPGESEETSKNTETAESETPPAGEGDDQSTEAEDGEGKDKAKAFDESLLDKEDSTPPTKKTEAKTEDAAFNKSKKIDTFFERVANGKINPTTNQEWSLDDIDEVWVKNAVSDRLGDIEQKKPVETKADESDVYERIKYDQLLESIPELPESKQKAIANLTKELQEEGVTSKFKALKRALAISNIELEAEKRGKKAALLGVSGGGSGGGVNTQEKSKVTPEFTKNTGITKDDVKKIEKFDFLNPNK